MCPSHKILPLSSLAGDRGLEICCHGGRSALPVDLCNRVRGRDAGPLPSASLPESDRASAERAHRGPASESPHVTCVTDVTCVSVTNAREVTGSDRHDMTGWRLN